MITRDEWLKNQKINHKLNYCTFNNYDTIDPNMIEQFWKKPGYARKLVNINKIRAPWRNSYHIAKKNVAMLDYIIQATYNIYFDINGNLLILINNASLAAQNNLIHYANKINRFNVTVKSFCYVNSNVYEKLFN